jgi:subtilase family serine protease
MKNSTLLALSLACLAIPSAAWSQAPDPSSCIPVTGAPCYTPQQLQTAYGVTPWLNAGYNGTGQIIVLIEAYGSPTIKADLKAFDAAYGLPDPPALQVLAPLGTVPFDPNNEDQQIWAFETSLDVQWSHAMAPGAAIVVLTSPVDETEGIHGLPEFLALEKFALDNHLGNIISQSWGTAENTLFDAAGTNLIHEFEAFYARAAAEQVTVLAGAGDSGSTNVDVNGDYYPFPTVLYPASSPWVLAVGGTTIQVSSSGVFESETVWNDENGATGGGISQYFAQPFYQGELPRSVQKQLNRHRGIPDVVFNADPVLTYIGFYPDPSDNGFYTQGGTSESTPAWAGIISIANQLAGRPLGFIQPTLYAAGAAPQESEFFHDVTTGNNGANGVAGYYAMVGWDLASGWGSPNQFIWGIKDHR